MQKQLYKYILYRTKDISGNNIKRQSSLTQKHVQTQYKLVNPNTLSNSINQDIFKRRVPLRNRTSHFSTKK